MKKLLCENFSGKVQIWDGIKSQKICDLTSHTDRVATSSWNSSLLATGMCLCVCSSRDFMFFCTLHFLVDIVTFVLMNDKNVI